MFLLHYVAPESFVQTVSVMLITMLLFGGSACLMGPIIGVGSVLLLNELLRRAKGLGLTTVTLEVRETNAPAIALYQKHDFVPVGRRKNYYTSPTEDAILMTVTL